MDVEALMLDEKFLRFLSTIRFAAGIEQTAYGPEDRHLHFVEGRRSLWCDILRTAETAQSDAILRILMAEDKASKESTNGRRKYERLDIPDGDPGSGSRPDPGGLTGYLDYGTEPSAS